MSKAELEKIYETNKQIELDGKIVGHRAKKLLKNSNRALKIIHDEIWTGELEKDLIKELKELEDDFAREGWISACAYNLGVRGKIHVAIQVYDEHAEYKKQGWVTDLSDDD